MLYAIELWYTKFSLTQCEEKKKSQCIVSRKVLALIDNKYCWPNIYAQVVLPLLKAVFQFRLFDFCVSHLPFTHLQSNLDLYKLGYKVYMLYSCKRI